MLKQNKAKLIISSLAILIPMLIGCILWSKLPDTIATHFSADNSPDGFGSKAFTVFGMPLVLLALHLICLIATSADPKYKNIGKKPLGIVFWIIPSMSLLVLSVIYTTALGYSINIGFVISLFLGILLIILGNLMPKAKQNYTFGIKLPWTLDNSENWNRTHRLSGWCMVIAGVIVAATSFTQKPWIIFPPMILAVIIPVVYSYVYYKNHHKNEAK